MRRIFKIKNIHLQFESPDKGGNFLRRRNSISKRSAFQANAKIEFKFIKAR